MQSPIDEIKDRLDIVEVIGSYIKLQKTGANYRAVCPFHSEKKPSFFISPARQIWHCFGCSKGGDVFGFVKEIEGVEFGDALRILAQKAGVELKKPTAKDTEWQSKRAKLYEICELGTKFFEKQLQESKSGAEAKNYLLSRGINEESIKRWRIGYAPDVWQGLSDFLTGRGYTKDEIERAGLGLTSEKGSFYDRFRGRIIFPIFDLNSQVIGFGGRVFKDKDKKEIAKYVNTPNTLLYDKSRILYGLDRAKVEIRRKDHCILVEGYTDVIMAYQAGSQNVIATSGTALTPFQLKTLKRYTENLVLGFDMDIAGDSATKRGIDLAESAGFNIKILRLPGGKDAAEIISKDPKEWEAALTDTKSILDFYFESAFKGKDPGSSDGKKEISKILLPALKRIPNRIVQAHWIGELAKRLGVKNEDIEEEMKKTRLDDLSDLGLEPEEIINLPAKSRKDMLEETLLVLLLKDEKGLELIKEQLRPCLSVKAQEILSQIEKKEAAGSDFFNYLSLRAEIEELEEKEVLPEIENCIKEIRFLEVKKNLNHLAEDIKRAESAKDWDRVGQLTKEFNDLIQNEKENIEKETK